MGVGKTTGGRLLSRRRQPAVFLEGDWCWDMHPFQVTEETKALVLDNICHLLRGFLACSAFSTVVFCWVLHRREIWDHILSRLDTTGWQVLPVALTCSPDALKARLRSDIRAGTRTPDVLERSLGYLPLYRELGLPILDTTHLSPSRTAGALAALAPGSFST